MKKFFAVVKHEYKKIVLRWAFLLGTLLFPVLGLCFAFVPALIFSIKGEPTRIVIVDPSNKIAPRLKSNLSNDAAAEKGSEAAKSSPVNIGTSQTDRIKDGARSAAEGFIFVDYSAAGKSPDQIRKELTDKAVAKEIDAYLLIPENFAAPDAKFEFLSRKAGDFVAGDQLKAALNEAVRSQRLADANIDEKAVRALTKDVDLDSKSIDEKGREKDSSALLAASFVVGLMIYLTLTIYGQIILGAVVEEKETRIAEILFSSARPFELMLGKLVGVGLAGLTQLGIWVVFAFGVDRLYRCPGRSFVAASRFAAHHAADGDVFPAFLFARLLFVRIDLRLHRFDGNVGAGRRTIRVSADNDPADRVLLELCGDSRPQFDAFVLGVDRAVLRSDNDAGSDPRGNAAILADRVVDRYQCSRDRVHGLAGQPCLPRRNAYVWQAGDDPRGLEVDPTGVNE